MKTPADVPRNTMQAWIRAGLIRLETPGHGGRRRYRPEELSAARALDTLRRLAGAALTRECAGGANSARRQLQRAVAEAARSNPPGTVVELETGPPWLRVVVVVPEP